MAGEWIPIDISLDQKPEVQELIDLTGEPVETVCFRLWKLWGWASMNSEDGTVRATPARLARTCGGGPEFWQAVETVGWVRFVDDGAAEIPGWGRRFTQSAKARAMHIDRASRARQAPTGAQQKRSKSARGECAPAQQKRTREEERTVSSSSSPPVDVEADGATLRAAWNEAARRFPDRVKPCSSDRLPAAALDRLAEPGWLSEALEAIGRLHECRYFTTPIPLAQFAGVRADGRRFTSRVLDQEFDNAKTPAAGVGPRAGHDERRPAAAASADWQRAASDPETIRRREEYLAAKSAKSSKPSGTDDIEAARAAVLDQLRSSGA